MIIEEGSGALKIDARGMWGGRLKQCRIYRSSFGTMRISSKAFVACLHVPYESLRVEEQQVDDGQSDGGTMGHGDTQHHR